MKDLKGAEVGLMVAEGVITFGIAVGFVVFAAYQLMKAGGYIG